MMSRFFQTERRRVRTVRVVLIRRVLMGRWGEVPILVLLVRRVRSREDDPGRQRWWKVLIRRDRRRVTSQSRIESVWLPRDVKRGEVSIERSRIGLDQFATLPTGLSA
jgi:hypothetical protein